MIRTAIVGCGRMGRRRAAALADARLVAVADVDEARARDLAARFPGCASHADWRAVVGRDDVEAVIVATTHDGLAPVTLAAVERGRHVLVEKPAARRAAELAPVAAAAAAAGVTVKVGYNHRFHPAALKARALIDEGAVGPLLYLRGRYGHGGRPGYEREWRADPARAGGGELLDQGVHLIDLARWFAGDFVEAAGRLATYYWDMPVEDNAFVQLRTAAGQVAWLHASWTEWKNLFSFEVVGRAGKLQWDGLGGSYGLERLTLYRMRPEMGPPETTTWEYPGEDLSWRAEWRHFLDAVAGKVEPWSSLEDTLAVLRLVERVYAQGEPGP
jgi:predicted dehydrogenase